MVPETVARVLGLLSLSLPKVQLLDVSRKLAEVYSGPTSEGLLPFVSEFFLSSDTGISQATSRHRLI